LFFVFPVLFLGDVFFVVVPFFFFLLSFYISVYYWQQFFYLSGKIFGAIALFMATPILKNFSPICFAVFPGD